jgi:putative transposase
MGRRPRIQYPGALYHVFPRGNHRERIHHTDQDCRILERYLIDAARKTGVIVRCWYPMPNHLHAMVYTPLGNISEFMQRWMSRYARYYNRTHGTVGHLFQGRYGYRLVQTDAHMKELIRYIHLQRYRTTNPEGVDPICDRYSSHRFYMGETCDPDVFDWIKPMLMLFGDDLETARKEYAKFLADGLANGNWEDFYQPKNDVLGDDGFLKQVEKKQVEHKLRTTLPLERREHTLQLLLQSAERAFGIKADELCSSSQQRTIARMRQAVAYIGRRIGLTVTELAKALRRDPSTVSLMIDAAPKRADGEIRRLKKIFKSSMPDTNDVL